jgi:hypothetical protein
LSFLLPLTPTVHSYDFDTDPNNRRENPDFFGFIPDDGTTRTILLILLTVNSAALLLIRSFSGALLFAMDPSYLGQYWLGDVAIYLAQKVARGDFWYFVPIEGLAGFVVSLVQRIVIKTITDYSGVLQFRHPGELGGFYWTANLITSVLFCFVITLVYFHIHATAAAKVSEISDYFEDDTSNSTSTSSATEGGSAMQKGTVWLLVAALSATWASSSAAISLLMNRKYWGTFISAKTGKQNTQDHFFSEDDKSKAIIFHCSRNQWSEIESAVRAWVLENWWKWKKESPDWFTDELIARIPDDFIPKGENRSDLNEIRKDVRRRSSLLGTVVSPSSGSRRLSLGRGSIVPVISLTLAETGAIVEEEVAEEKGGEQEEMKELT